MNAVRPLSSIDIVQMFQSVEDLKDASEMKDKDSGDMKNSDDDDLMFTDEKFADDDALAKCLSPLATIMKKFGFYFHHAEAMAVSDNSGSNDSSSAKKQRLYCIAILTLMWLNAIRCMMAFTADDKFGSQFLMKLVWIAIVVLCAILHSSYFIACESGALDRVIREIRVSHATLLYFRKFFLTVKPVHSYSTPKAITRLLTVV
jgi:hypothetical protein